MEGNLSQASEKSNANHYAGNGALLQCNVGELGGVKVAIDGVNRKKRLYENDNNNDVCVYARPRTLQLY